VASAPPPAAPRRAPAASPPAEARPPGRVERPRSGWAVQIGAFADRAAADALVERLRAGHVQAYLAEGKAGDAARWRVRVGPYATRGRADEEAARLQDAHRLPTWVLAEEGS
jgi:DedD protein